MTETNASTADASAAAAPKAAAKKRGSGLNSMLLADLKAMAGGMGIAGAGSMKKAQLVEAIKAAQSQSGAKHSAPKASDAPVARTTEPADGDRPDAARRQSAAQQQANDVSANPADSADKSDRAQGERGAAARDKTDQGKADQGKANQPKTDQGKTGQGKTGQGKADQGKADQPKQEQAQRDQAKQGQPKQDQQKQDQQKQDQPRGGQAKGGQARADGAKTDQNRADQNRADQSGAEDDGDDGDDGEGGNRRNRRRRGRDRTSRVRNEPDTEVREDDVLVPAAGILDVLDNYAFVRTSGYLAGTEDVYLSLSLVRKYGLRRGDAIAGQVRQPREGERREKFNPMVRIDSVNGDDPDHAKNRPEFAKLTPLSPNERLRLETTPENLTGRVIDIVAPIGKGQRALILGPGHSGRTTLLQSIATSITANNPDAHLMVVLVDERPEEVTDFQRSVRGEVIASTFDRPAADHTTMAELAIERAKRLVELGHDVVVLMDGITRLGRAYNQALPAGGRTVGGGVDIAALFPPKQLLGAARNIENGGSLTLLATAVVDSGSATDEVIFEEIKGTANAEIRLDGALAVHRVHPAIDPIASGTRREELLLSDQEVQIVRELRRALSAAEDGKAAEMLLDRLRKTRNNVEFLTQVQRTTPAKDQR